jgi:Cu/Ag efflux protein CusF
MENETKAKVHDAELIESHEEQMANHTKELKKGTGEFKKLNNKINSLEEFIKDEFLIVKNAVGEKSKQNGERDEQIRKLKEESNKVHQAHEELEEKDETIMDVVQEIRLNQITEMSDLKLQQAKELSAVKERQAELKGLFEGKEEGIRQATLNKQYEYTTLYNFSNNRFNNLWTFIGGSGLACVGAGLLDQEYFKWFMIFFIGFAAFLIFVEYGLGVKIRFGIMHEEECLQEEDETK